MNVLSLFDGMSCGRVALDRVGIEVEKYYASEIDKYAMQISNKNYPDIIQLGSVTEWREWGIDFSSIDLLMAGFPCQAWSVAGKQKGDTDPRGALVHDLIAIWQEIKKHNPNVKFLFENVKMKKEFLDYINNLFGVEPILINSALVSAQNRKRYYWTNIEGIEQPKDKEIYLDTILDTPATFDATKGRYLNKATILGRRLNKHGKREDYNKNIRTIQCLEVRASNRQKSNCITTVAKDTVLTPLDIGRHPDVYGRQLPFRDYTADERCKLQTLPQGYCDGVSYNQVVKLTGNGWTVDVIKHIFKGLK